MIRKTVRGQDARTTMVSDRGCFHISNRNTIGKYNVNIGEGNEIHIGDRTYNQWDDKAIEALVKEIQKTSGIHQDTQGGDAAGRDIDKRNVYENCTFIQLLAQDNNFSSFSQKSFGDLDLSTIPQESIQQAYQDSLPPDAGVWGLAGNDLTQILQTLEQFRKVPEFLDHLSHDENVPLQVRDRIAKYLASKKYLGTQNNTSEEDYFSEQQVQLKSYLIATLVPCDGDKFLLNAWLIIDDSVRDLSKFQSLLDQNEQQTGTLCKLPQVSTELNKFIKKALRYLRGKRYSLIIEFFLPSDLMCMEIDRWKITDPIADEITLGIKYPIRLRSLERLNLDYLDSYLSQWYEYWDKVRNILHNEPTQELFEPLEAIESFNWKVLRSNLKERIGLKVTCPHPQSIRKDLFRAILQATTPIAIWIRNDIPNLDRVTAIDEILTFKPLCHLCESVKLTREEADAQTEEHLGHHLALLWENPYRLTPDIMVELIAPGQ
jgi:vWA-MoxR associated protein C-terminal domain/Effector-associated domain 10